MKKFSFVLTVLVAVAWSLHAQKPTSEFIIATTCGDTRFVVDVTDCKFFNGAKLQLWEYYKGSTNQQFRLYEYNDVDPIILFYCANGFNWAWDVTDGKTEDGNQIQIWEPYPKSSYQRWWLEWHENYDLIPKYCYIRSDINTDYVLTAESRANGARVILKKFDGSVNQRWHVLKVGGSTWEYFNKLYGKIK